MGKWRKKSQCDPSSIHGQWLFVDFITSKMWIFFRRNEILFYAENQRKFTYLTSEASSIIEFELIFGIIKDFIESKKIHVADGMKSTCNFVPLLSTLWIDPECFSVKKIGQNRQNRQKTLKCDFSSIATLEEAPLSKAHNWSDIWLISLNKSLSKLRKLLLGQLQYIFQEF